MASTFETLLLAQQNFLANPPDCKVAIGSSFFLPATQDIFAQGGWAATSDPYGMFFPDTNSNMAYIQIPVAGRYDISYISNLSLSSGQSGVGYIAYNNAVSGAAIARAGSVAMTGGTDGCWCHAIRFNVPLNAGDKLYWANWATNSCNVNAVTFSVPTEVNVMYRHA